MCEIEFNLVLSLVHEKVINTDNDNILIYKDDFSTPFVGLMTSDGKILTSENIVFDTLLFKENIVVYRDGDYKKLYLILKSQGSLRLRQIYKAKDFSLHEVYTNFVVISTDNGLLILDYQGESLNGKEYLNIIKIKERNTYKFFGVNFLTVRERFGVVRSIDIIDKFGNILKENVEWNDALKEQYLINISSLYGRDIKLIEYKTIKGRRIPIIDGWRHIHGII